MLLPFLPMSEITVSRLLFLLHDLLLLAWLLIVTPEHHFPRRNAATTGCDL